MRSALLTSFFALPRVAATEPDCAFRRTAREGVDEGNRPAKARATALARRSVARAPRANRRVSQGPRDGGGRADGRRQGRRPAAAAVVLAQHSTESGHDDRELPLVEAGVLGTINVLRDLDPKTFANRVTVECNAPGAAGKPEFTIDGGGDSFTPTANKPCVLTFALPAVQTVSSLAVAYEYAPSDVPNAVLLEGSADSGKTWAPLCKVWPRQRDVVKAFKPAKADRLRLTQETQLAVQNAFAPGAPQGPRLQSATRTV